LADCELENQNELENYKPLGSRFRGYLPVVVDVETGGFNAQTDALLELGVICINMQNDGKLCCGKQKFFRIEPFSGANIEQSALDFTGIRLNHPLRMAVTEDIALKEAFSHIRRQIKLNECKRAILVGHNANFDLAFINAAANRCDIKRNPFHPFSTFDTVSLAGVAYGQTVLAKACYAANIEFDKEQAHSAQYDTQKTAELFCQIVNLWHIRSN